MENKIFNENNIITMSNISDKSISGIIKTKRKFIGSELDETHYKTAISQIKNNLKLYENTSE
jgi:hypothetical protein